MKPRGGEGQNGRLKCPMGFLVLEYFWPENSNIQLTSKGTSVYIHKQVTKTLSNHSKILVQINNRNKETPDYIYFTIYGTASVSNPQGSITIYGVKDWSDSVDPSVYDSAYNDQMFEFKNGDMQMQTELDLSNHKIIKLANPIDAGDACKKRSLDIVETK